MNRIGLMLVLGAPLCAQLLTAPSAAQYDAQKARARQQLQAGRIASAIELAQPLAKLAPDDIDLQYTLAKAYRLAGNLAQAEKTTQWMLDLRPEFPGGLHEAALLREAFDDLTGALEMLHIVYRATPPSKAPERMEMLGDFARIFDKQKRTAEAGAVRREIEKMKGQVAPHETATPAGTVR